jgi:hypothetical protein
VNRGQSRRRSRGRAHEKLRPPVRTSRCRPRSARRQPARGRSHRGRTLRGGQKRRGGSRQGRAAGPAGQRGALTSWQTSVAVTAGSRSWSRGGAEAWLIGSILRQIGGGRSANESTAAGCHQRAQRRCAVRGSASSAGSSSRCSQYQSDTSWMKSPSTGQPSSPHHDGLPAL